jgi:parallel beta-helix repeat protein
LPKGSDDMRRTGGFKKPLFSILTAYVMASTCFLGMLFIWDENVSATNDPVQPADGGTVIVDGNWTVEDTREYYNCTLIMNGNLSIMPGGMLTFRNVTLIMNNTENGTFNIEVLSGGGFHILDYDDLPNTIFDRSNITSGHPDFHYNFWVRSGADFVMKNSEFHESGWDYANNYGLMVWTDGILIENSYFSNNAQGVTVYFSSSGTIANCTFSQIKKRVISISSSDNFLVTNNTISNGDVGIWIGYSDNNYILNNRILFCITSGIHITNSNLISLIGNNISFTWDIGILFHVSTEITVIDNVMIEDGIHIAGYALENWNSHTIDMSNTVNGKTLYYLKDQTSGVISSDAGEIILANCNNMVLENHEFINADVGIEMGFSNDILIINNNISSNSYCGIFMINCDDNNITNNNISLNRGIGIYFRWCDNNQIFRNNILSNDGEGIYSQVSNYNDIIGNTILYHYIGIFFRGECDYNTILNNTVCYNVEEGIFLWIDSDYNEIRLNNASYNSRGILIWSECDDNIVSENIASFNDREGIFIWSNSNRTEIIKNYVSNNDWGLFIGYTSNDNRIIENQIINNQIAMYLRSVANNNIISRNTVLYNEEDMFLWDVSYNRFLDNQFLYSNISSIYIWGTSRGAIYNDFTNNEIFMNKGDGITIRGTCNNNFTNNVITTLNGTGFRIWSKSNNNTIRNNTINSNNEHTIYVSSSKNNSIYHNNIMGNGILAYDDTNNSNYWDNGYPSGGNYWSDYSGIDLYNGPNQDIPGSDGIGDTPYIIDVDSQDNYPLMFIINGSIFLHEGWNLISVPVIQQDEDLDSVFTSISGFYDAVQYLETTDPENPWRHNRVLKPSSMNDLNEADHRKGVWIHITKLGGVNFQLRGAYPTMNHSIPLHVGWNLVGYPSLTSHNRTNGLNTVVFGPDVDCIQWYDASTKTWHFMGPDDFFVPGRGYWVHSKVDTVWDVPL